MTLHRFWFRFSFSEKLGLGYGVTAYNYDDAVAILTEIVFSKREFPPIESVLEDVDISTLDQKHVIPNMEAPVWRGIWYPKGFTSS